MFTIKFDPLKIKCTKVKDGSNIVNGTKLIEGTKIKFETIDKTKVEWTIGKYTYDWDTMDSINCIVFEADTDTDIIEVSYK